MQRTPQGRVYTRAEKPPSANIVPVPSPDPDAEGRRPVGIDVDGEVVRGFPTPSGRLEFYSSTLKAWGWPEYALPTYIRSHVHPQSLEEGEVPLIPTFRLPVQIHTRSANAKWLDEIAHTNPLWIHPSHAATLGLATGDLVRVETRIGHFVVKAWVTEGIRPGVVACSHHMGRWKLEGPGQRQMMATVSLRHEGTRWLLRRERGVEPFDSADPDTSRIWWTDAGVHQNLTFPVQPDPISGMHCWHQAVRVKPAEPGDRYGDVSVDTEKSREAYAEWLEARTAGGGALARRDAAALLAAASAQAGPRGLQAAGGDDKTVTLRLPVAEPAGVLLRALAVGLLGGSAALVLRYVATEAPRLVWHGDRPGAGSGAGAAPRPSGDPDRGWTPGGDRPRSRVALGRRCARMGHPRGRGPSKRRAAAALRAGARGLLDRDPGLGGCRRP